MKPQMNTDGHRFYKSTGIVRRIRTEKRIQEIKTRNIIRDDTGTKNYHEGTKRRNPEKLTTKGTKNTKISDCKKD